MKKCLACLLLGCAAAAHATDPLPPEFRLGDVALPLEYEARLALDPESPTFSGEIRIRLKDDFNRVAAFAFVRTHFDALVAKLPPDTPAQFTTPLGDLCTREERSAFVAFFEPRAARFSGGPRHYDQALEAIDLCLAR
jgi:hypothetical protein